MEDTMEVDPVVVEVEEIRTEVVEAPSMVHSIRRLSPVCPST
jgi:hypothetical protein